MPVGKRIYLQRELPEPQLVEAFRQIPAANVADVMERSCAMNPRIRLMSRPQRAMAGVALTVKARAGDNLALHAALSMAAEGDVLVVSNEGDTTRSLLGEIMLTYLYKEKRVAGIVLDGPIRDIEEVSSWDLPIYATGTTPGGPYKEGPGEVNVPIACGEISVTPGDIILGDADGVIVIPRRDAGEILMQAQTFHETDQKKLEAVRTGAAKRDWVDKALAEKEFEIIDRVHKP